MTICLATQHANPLFTPLALLYLKAHLVAHTSQPADAVRILEFTQDSSADDMARQILAGQPAVVGLSCYVWNVRALTAAARLIKAALPRVRIVLGGPEVGPIAADVLRAHPAVDAIVRGEGEEPFAALVDAWTTDRALDTVPGISFRRRGEIGATADAPIVHDLGALASPHLARFVDPTGRIICFETQRGCVFRCNFCFYNKDLSIRNRRFDLDRIKAELLHCLDEDVAEIYFMDPIFNLNAQRAKEICRFVAEHNHRRVPFHAEVWAEFIDDELAQLMRAANFQFLEVGLQSTDATALATVERRLRAQRFEEGLASLRKHHLKFELQLIFGLPGETMASFRKSLNYAASLDPEFLTVFQLLVLPGTELWRKARDLTLEFDPDPPYYVRSHFSMTADDIAYGVKINHALGYLRNSRTMRLLARAPGVSFADLIDEWIIWHDEQAWPDEMDPNPKLFVAHFCDRKQIPPAVYQDLASWEFSG
jgi:anaerobic magnesium-protoporphyrin IX monomethyl ester cyclase